MEKKKYYKAKYTKEEYDQNFFNVVKKPYMLSSKGFNENSNIKFQAYRIFFGLIWTDVLKMYGKYDEFYDYILKEFDAYYKETNSTNINAFTEQHKYITYRIISPLGLKKIKKDLGMKKFAPTEDDYISNFLKVKEKLNETPLYAEFEENSKISITRYAIKFDLHKNIYDQVVKMCSSKEEYEDYMKRKDEHKTQMGKKTGALCAKYSLEDFETEFHKTFKYCKDNFNEYPSKRLFDKLSLIHSRTYRNKLNMSWLDICEHYGYKVERNHKIEKCVLNYFAKILQSEFTPQKTWNWLKGVGGTNLYCDGYFEEYELAVEFDGRQHRVAVDKFGGEERLIIQQQNDQIKNALIPEHNLKLIRIDSRDKWWGEGFILSKLAEAGIEINKNSN